MAIAKTLMSSLAGLSILLASPVHANEVEQSEQLRRLDIMLMVTSLQCRSTANNFQSEFQAFEAAHLPVLNDAAMTMRENLAKQFGPNGAGRELDRLSTAMANQYGQGHPWLTCAELKSITRRLVIVQGRAELLDAAQDVLAPSARGNQLAIRWRGLNDERVVF